MNCKMRGRLCCRAFSLIEVMTALIILALFCSSVLVVVNRCMASATDSVLRMQAFEVVRENMEKLLASNSVTEMVEYGSSDRYPDIQWQTTVETFYEPVTSRMWVQGICSAEYTDSAGDVQKIEMTHWLTSLTEEQIRKILGEQGEEEEQLTEQIIETEEQAAEYAGVDAATIRQWIENGMPLTKDGYYIRKQLDLYKQHNGSPPAEDKERLLKEAPDEQAKQGDEDVKGIDEKTIEELVKKGLPREVLEKLLKKTGGER